MIGLKAATARGVIAGIDRGIEEIAGILDILRDETAVLECHWDGDAREAMSVAVREWNAAVERLRLLAGEASRVAGQTVERVDAFDRRRAGAWQR